MLPFADMSESGDQAWFAEGIAEELLHALAGIEELRVMARTSSFAFKDTDKTIAEIAEILGVQAVMEGSVRRAGDKVRILVTLTDDLADKLDAVEIVNRVAGPVDGRGGGRADFAQAGGKKPENLPAALDQASRVVESLL